MRWSTIISAAHLVLLGTGLSSALPSDKTKSSIIGRNPKQPAKIVYRGDFRSPLEIAQQGGFRPRGDDAYANDSHTFSLWRHTVGEFVDLFNPDFLGQSRPHTETNRPWASAFVSVSTTTAESSRYGTWLYRIHATPNMIDPTVESDENPEVYALAGVHWGQVMGWYQIDATNTAITDDNFTPNPSYDPTYDQFTLTPHDRGIAYNHPADNENHWTAFMNSPNVGSAVGFTGQFPLQFGTYPLDNLPGPSPLGQNPGTSNPGTSAGAEAQLPSLTQDEIMLFAEFLEAQQDAPCDISGINPQSQALILEADSALAFSMATINTQQQGAADPFASPDLEMQAILDDLEGAEAPSTCSIVSECSRINPQSPQKRAAALSKELCQKLRWPKQGGAKGGKDASPSKKPGSATKIVFIGTYHWPEEVKKQGGLVPSADDGTQALQAHLLLGTAAQEAAATAKNQTDGFHGVVYAIHVSPNMLLTGKDCVVVGGALWRQVVGWIQVPLDYAPPPKGPEERKKLRKHFEDAFREATKDANSPLFQKNPDYDPKFNGLGATSTIPDLASPQALDAFMDAAGKDVNWKGSFPLIQTQRISGPESKAAKKSNKLAPPHDASFWKKTTNFIGNHKLAIAMLPAVALLNLIPGLGEAADVAEIAALSADAAETIELAEASGEVSELTPLIGKLKVD